MPKRIVYISIIHLKKKKQLQKLYRDKNHRQQGSSKTRRKNLRIGVDLSLPDFLYVGSRVVYKRIAKYVKKVVEYSRTEGCMEFDWYDDVFKKRVKKMNPDTKEVVNKKEYELEIHSPFNNSRWTLTAGEFEYGFSAPANSTEDIIKGLREFANLLEHTNDPKNQRTFKEAIQQTKTETTAEMLDTFKSVFDKLKPKDSFLCNK